MALIAHVLLDRDTDFYESHNGSVRDVVIHSRTMEAGEVFAGCPAKR